MEFVQKKGAKFTLYWYQGHRHHRVSLCTVVSYVGLFFFLRTGWLVYYMWHKTGFLLRFYVFGSLSTLTLSKSLISPSFSLLAVWWLESVSCPVFKLMMGKKKRWEKEFQLL